MTRIGTLYLNSRPRSALLRVRLFAPCWKQKLTFPFWKEKLRLAHFLSPKRNAMIPGEKEGESQNGWRRNGDSHLTKQLENTHITMNINHVIISGNLVANPALRETNTGTRVATATIANNEFFDDDKGESQEVTTFVE
jgi:Single-strand binding protein family